MNPHQIQHIKARRVWDSRGFPTVEAEVRFAGGGFGRAIAPAGASRGSREATDLRDASPRLGGRDVRAAVAAVNDVIAPALTGQDGSNQQAIDQCLIDLDGTPLKTHLGGNAIVATSLAILHAAADATGSTLWQYLASQYRVKPQLPLPEIQIFGGGAHAGRRVDIQDFMVMVPGAESFEDAIEITAEIYYAAGRLMADAGKLAGVADEGGWWPMFDTNEQALELLIRAIEMAGQTPGEKVVISLDIAASEFGSANRYKLGLDKRELDSDALCEMLGQWIDRYPIVSIEDPLAEDDDAGMRAFTAAYGKRIQIIGDDYLVTNKALVDRAVQNKTCNAVLIKVNQAGTVTESLDTLTAAKNAGWGTIVSARSGETEDLSICHLATGLSSGQLKVGSFSRSERMAKWNECIRIQDAIGPAQFAGSQPLADTEWGRRHNS
ncbi:MAG: phosphopyruvate hydratase [Burkholderiaceae bacterium]